MSLYSVESEYRSAGFRRLSHAEAAAQSASLATADAAEGIAALLGKRPPSFTGR